MAHLEEIRATFERNPGHLAVADIRWLIEEAEMTRSRTKSDLAADILVLKTALAAHVEEREARIAWNRHAMMNACGCVHNHADCVEGEHLWATYHRLANELNAAAGRLLNSNQSAGVVLGGGAEGGRP